MMAIADIKDIVSRANDLKSYHSGQDKIFDGMESMYFMRDPDEEKLKRSMDDVKLTISPDARNALVGAQRLLVATDPVFRVTSHMDERQSSAIEMACDAMWNGSGKVNGTPVHYDLVLSGLLYDRVHLAVTSTADLVEASSKRSKAYKARAEAIARRTPFLFECWNPRECYPLFDRQGLAAHLRSVEITVADVRGSYGDVAGLGKYRSTDKVTLNEWWDLEYHVVWIDGVEDPLINAQHGLAAIPIVVGYVNGSTSLFVKPEDQLQPFLYTLWQSYLWNRQNLAMTVMYSMVAKIGANPMMVFKTGQADRELDIKYDDPGGVVKIYANEELYPLQKMAIDPSIPEALRMADEKGTESTIYRQALGQSLGGNAPYSSVALLSQAGRLPLISPQKRIGWVIGRVMELVYAWMKSDNAVRKYGDDEIVPADIPDDLEIECSLDIAMPQDYIQSAQLALALAGGDRPLASMEWTRDKVLKIGQNAKVQKQIWNEQGQDMKFKMYIQDMMQQAQAREAAMQQPPVPSASSGGASGTFSPGPELAQMPMMPGQGTPPGQIIQGGKNVQGNV